MKKCNKHLEVSFISQGKSLPFFTLDGTVTYVFQEAKNATARIKVFSTKLKHSCTAVHPITQYTVFATYITEFAKINA